jgi:hypothetical protein
MDLDVDESANTIHTGNWIRDAYNTAINAAPFFYAVGLTIYAAAMLQNGHRMTEKRTY